MPESACRNQIEKESRKVFWTECLCSKHFLTMEQIAGISDNAGEKSEIKDV